MTGRDLSIKHNKLITIASTFLSFFPVFILTFLWDIMKPFNGLLFILLRYLILKALVKECGLNIRIGANVKIINWQLLELGSNISIHDNCYLDAFGGIKIMNDVSIAHSTSLLSSNHTWQNINIPIKYNPVNKGQLIIENDVWLGCGCRILSGIVLKTRTIIAAGSVVTKNTTGNAIYGGVPAKIIKTI